MKTKNQAFSPAASWRQGVFEWGLLLVLVVAISWPTFGHLNDSYPQNYHGRFNAWMGLMAHNMEESGFVETRFMPHLNPNKSNYPNFRYYMSHPTLDVVFRAGLMRFLGHAEWVVRLPGLIGCLGALLFGFASLRRHFNFQIALGACLVVAGLPIFQRLIFLSMHHPMTLLTSLMALWFYLRFRERRRPIDLSFCYLSLFASMNFDWPGYFLVFLIWVFQLFRERWTSLVFGLPLLVVVTLAIQYLHVTWVLDRDLFSVLRASLATQDDFVASANPWVLFLRHQARGFSWLGGLIICGAGLLAFRASLGRNQRMVLGLGFMWGALNFLFFSSKGPYHDFWGCYWIPFFAYASAICLQSVERKMARTSLMFGTVLMVAVVGGLQVQNMDWNRGQQLQGDDLRKQAQFLKAKIPVDDRQVFVTNTLDFDPLILASYLRCHVFPWPLKQEDQLRAMTQGIRLEMPYMRGKRVLFFLDPRSAPNLKAALSMKTQVYAGFPNCFDISNLVWK